MTTVIVTGSRDWTDSGLIENKLISIGAKLVVQGGAAGADTIASEWAKYHDVEVDTVKANWNKYGKSAGPIRNRAMLEKYKNKPGVVVVVFRKNNSRGTTHCYELAKSLGFTVHVFDRTSQ